MNRTKIFIFVFFIGAIFSILGALILNKFGFLKTRNLAISEFRICTSDNSNRGAKQNESCGVLFPKGTQEIYACGYLNTEDFEAGKFISLSIYLYTDNIGIPIYEDQIDVTFSDGNYCHEIKLPTTNQFGSYTLKIYFFRNIVATSQFKIK